MRDLAAIAALYREIDATLEDQRSKAEFAGDAARANRIARKQAINDQAYFVLCWGQFETAVDRKCREAIKRRRGTPDWTRRRGWDLYNPDDKRLSGLSFEDRVALLVDRDGGKGSAWAQIMQYYALRNEIAHGSLSSTPIDVLLVVQRLFQLQGQLVS
jgi:hypothetical protein